MQADRTLREKENCKAENILQETMQKDFKSGAKEFDSAHSALYEGEEKGLSERFMNLCKILNTEIQAIKGSLRSEEEQLKVIGEIVEAFVGETWRVNRYMNFKNREQKIDNRYVEIFSAQDIRISTKVGIFLMRNLGDTIFDLYPSKPEAEQIAVIAWKEYVSLAQKFCTFVQEGDAEIYAAKIKKIDPFYVMPLKFDAGILSQSNQA